MKKLLLLSLLVISTITSAWAKNAVGVAVSREYADIGDIASISVYGQFTDEHSNLGFQVGTSLSSAEITDFDGYVDEYAAWEGFARMGLFSDLQIYVEAGIDLGEMIVHDDRHHDYYYYDDDHNEIDFYMGAGIGISTQNIDVRAFSRYRYIDGIYLTDNKDWFSGVEVSIHF
ncbi:MAG: hypothetical protein HWE13_13620 [Gammaproteobacteria bacterium]|nr:hypothetical protein [Gammaproteobacteria bacterium]NVK89168.1 hypothetical protein [Gammaproteobacteria bacterium]